MKGLSTVLKHLKLAIVLALLSQLLACSSQATEAQAGQEPVNKSYNFRKDIAYGSHNLQKLDVYWPRKPSESETGVLLLIHGGAWRTGDKQNFSGIAEFYAQRSFVVVNINYRLFPDDKHPAQINDVAKAFSWVWQNIGRYHGDRSNIVVAGHSAGAHLGLLLSCDAHYLQDEGLSTGEIAAVVADDTASFDLTQPADNEGWVASWVNRIIVQNFGPGQLKLRAASPYFQAQKAQDLGRFYLFTTDQRPLALKQAKKFAALLQARDAEHIESHTIAGLSHRQMAQALSDEASPISQKIISLLSAME